MIFNNLASKTVIRFEFANRRRTAYLPPFVAKQKHTTMKKKNATDYDALFQINALLKNKNMPFRARSFKFTNKNGSCGYHALQQAFAALPGHLFAGLDVPELRFVSATMLRHDSVAQIQALAAFDWVVNIDDIVKQTLDNSGSLGWMNHVTLALFASASKTNILVFQFEGYVVVAKSNRLLLLTFDACSVARCSRELKYHYYFVPQVVGEVPTERPTIVSVACCVSCDRAFWQLNDFVAV